MRKFQLLTIALVLTCSVSSSFAHSTATVPGKAPPRATVSAMTGEVVDPQCYLHDSRGEEHVSCAIRRARGGQGLAFLDEQSGKAYPLIAATHGANQNDKVLPLVGKRVAVNGVVFAKGQDAVLQVRSIAESKAQAKGR